jgi:hypothetical protein
LIFRIFPEAVRGFPGLDRNGRARKILARVTAAGGSVGGDLGDGPIAAW